MSELNRDEINAEFEAIWKRKVPDASPYSVMDDTTIHDLCRQFYNVGYGNGGTKALEMLRADRSKLSESVSNDLGKLLQ